MVALYFKQSCHSVQFVIVKLLVLLSLIWRNEFTSISIFIKYLLPEMASTIANQPQQKSRRSVNYKTRKHNKLTSRFLGHLTTTTSFWSTAFLPSFHLYIFLIFYILLLFLATCVKISALSIYLSSKQLEKQTSMIPTEPQNNNNLLMEPHFKFT